MKPESEILKEKNCLEYISPQKERKCKNKPEHLGAKTIIVNNRNASKERKLLIRKINKE